MKDAEIIEPKGDLKREVWVFYWLEDFIRSRIVLASYSFQERATKRHKWKRQSWWERLDNRDGNIEKPQVPLRVEIQARQHYRDFIDTIPIK